MAVTRQGVRAGGAAVSHRTSRLFDKNVRVRDALSSTEKHTTISRILKEVHQESLVG
jgi:hypothetical protein